MTEFEYGPVDVYVVSFEGDHLDAATASALGELMVGDEIRLLDLLIVSRGDDGGVTVREYEEFRDEAGFTIVELDLVIYQHILLFETNLKFTVW
jgi:hypothetical protein